MEGRYAKRLQTPCKKDAIPCKVTGSSSKLLQIRCKWHKERNPKRNPKPYRKILKLFFTHGFWYRLMLPIVRKQCLEYVVFLVYSLSMYCCCECRQLLIFVSNGTWHTHQTWWLNQDEFNHQQSCFFLYRSLAIFGNVFVVNIVDLIV